VFARLRGRERESESERERAREREREGGRLAKRLMWQRETERFRELNSGHT
jgi:hypothetical protein